MSTLLQPVTRWLDTLAPRERRMVVWGGAATAAVLFVFAGLLPLYTAAAKTGQNIERKQKDLSWMRSVAGELRAAGPADPSQTAASGQGSGQSLIVVIDQTAQQAGLGTSMNGAQPSGTGGIRVRLEGAPFDTVVSWLATLEQQHHIKAESASIDRGAKAGIVNVSVILKKV